MIIDWPGLGTKIGNLAIDAKKAADENLKKIIDYLGYAGVAFVVIGAYFLFKKK